MITVSLDKVSYSYRSKYQTIQAVKEVSCTFESATFYAIVGESGSGKSTLLSLIAGLDLPTEGDICINGKNIRELQRDRFRRDTASVVYQSFNLFPLLTAQENVMFPMELKGMKRQEAVKKAQEILERVGLPEKIRHQYPKMMSGGEQQRVAIARALGAGGNILLADEPTGNLDSENERHIVEILKKLASEDGYTVIVITHNPEVAEVADKIYRMKDGYLS